MRSGTYHYKKEQKGKRIQYYRQINRLGKHRKTKKQALFRLGLAMQKIPGLHINRTLKS